MELRAPPLPSLRFVILPGGSVEAGGEQPALVVSLPAASLAAAPKGMEHFLQSVQVTGDPRLASTVMALARELRWDAEEDLSRVVGDVAAHRIAGLARTLAHWQRDAAGRLAQSVRDYAVEEKRLLVSAADMEWFAGEVARLRDAIERLEKRVGRLG